MDPRTGREFNFPNPQDDSSSEYPVYTEDEEHAYKEHRKVYSMGFAMICAKCGGGSISSCACAKQIYHEVSSR